MLHRKLSFSLSFSYISYTSYTSIAYYDSYCNNPISYVTFLDRGNLVSSLKVNPVIHLSIYLPVMIPFTEVETRSSCSFS